MTWSADTWEGKALHALEQSKDQAHDDTTQQLWASRASAYAMLAVLETLRETH